jgi:sialidase-1
MALLGLVALNLSAKEPAPELTQTDLFVGGMDGMVQYRIPSLLTTPSGSLLAICEARVDRPGDAPNNIDIVMKRSDDLGQTWGRMQVLMDNGNGAAGDAVGLVDTEIGRVWVFVVYYPEGIGSPNAKHGLSGDTATYHAVYSDDDGHTWSDAIDFTAMFKEAGWRGGSVGPGTGLQLSSGRLVLPRYYFDAPLDAVRATTSFVSYSDDHGKTWHNGAMIGPAEETNECQLIELPDGSLLMDLRNEPHSGRVLRKSARSYDGGETWTEMVDAPFLIEPMMGCQASIFTYTLPSDYERHRILFSNPVSLRRENMNVQLSYDGGETWPVVRQLHGGPAAYSSLTVLPDMSIGCLYERGDEEYHEKITFARFNLAWLSRGKDRLVPKP